MKTTLHPEIVLGSKICIKLKHMLFPEEKWNEQMREDIAKKLSGIKKKAREFYCCETNVAALEKIDAMDLTDLQELCEVTFNGK